MGSSTLEALKSLLRKLRAADAVYGTRPVKEAFLKDTGALYLLWSAFPLQTQR